MNRDAARAARAARDVDTIPDRVDRLSSRLARAETVLRVTLTAADRLDVPGYRITLGPDGRPTVARSAIINAAQLALWQSAPDPTTEKEEHR